MRVNRLTLPAILIVLAALSAALSLWGSGGAPRDVAAFTIEAANGAPLQGQAVLVPVPPGGDGLSFAPLAVASIPDLVNLQGRLTDSGGNAVANGSYSVRFSVWDTGPGAGGTELWNETQTVTTSGGLFSVSLGSVTALTRTVFDGSPRYLELKVGTDPAMTPRQQFVTVPYAFFAEVAHDLQSLRVEDVACALGGNCPNLIGGFQGNSVTAGVRGATIGGGGDPNLFGAHRVTDEFGTVAGGFGNTAGNDTGTTIDSRYATVGGGTGNEAAATYATVAGGNFNEATVDAATVGGGEFNRARGEGATIAGGDDNEVTGTEAAIGGGVGNVVEGDFGGVAGGSHNVVTDHAGYVGGGDSNQAGDNAGTAADRPYATVGGGVGNNATGEAATVAGGGGNRADGYRATVTGGVCNFASPTAAPACPTNELDPAANAFVGGGFGNTASGNAATIAGGGRNTASGNNATVGGGSTNTATDNGSTVAGGASNAATAGTATVGGGIDNLASGSSATIAGGEEHTASGQSAFIGGGEINDATATGSAVVGGINNNATASEAFVGGGGFNFASGANSAVAGGSANVADGFAATVPGGRLNTAAGDYSFAAGRRAKANHAGAIVLGDSTDADVASSTANEFTVRAAGGSRIYSNSTLTTGVSLAAGGGSWSSISSRSLKANFEAVDSRHLLERLAAIPIKTWNYVSQDESVRHIGPTAEDFFAAFGIGEDDKHITTIDADGVALAAIQGLYELVQERDARIARLEAQVENLGSGGPLPAQGEPPLAPVSGLTVTWLILGIVLGAVAIGNGLMWRLVLRRVRRAP